MKRIAVLTGVVLLVVGVLGAAGALYLHRRALPQVAGTLRAEGLEQPVEILRDRWGVPHISAAKELDGYFAMGWVTAQDRLFQMHLLRHASQGRLAELFGPQAVRIDKLFRTVNFKGNGMRMLARTRPEVRAAMEAYYRGANAYLVSQDGRLPIAFTLLGIDCPPFSAEDFAGVLGFITWPLDPAWTFDPIYQKLISRLGAQRVAQLFPYTQGGSPAVYPAVANMPTPKLFQLSSEQRALLADLPRLVASNTWAVGPAKSASGKAMLANDPHLALGLPGVWYEVHLQAGALNVIGAMMPGIPMVAIGHNRDIAWGFTNLGLDESDFFLEKLNPDHPDEVMYRGQWVKLHTRREVIQVKGGQPVELLVRESPHGPLVSELLPGQSSAVSFQTVLATGDDYNELNGMYDLDRARNWDQFRRALSQFGVLAQNVSYADHDGHIGMQASGRIPIRRGDPTGAGFRVGWDGSQEWDGFVPFQRNPYVLDPPQGWVAAANNATFPRPAPLYITAYWEPMDRILRIRQMLQEKDRLSVQDFRRMQMDTVFISAREEVPMILRAYQDTPPPDALTREALELLRTWNGDMTADSQAATVFAAYYKHLFYEIFADEFGMDLAEGLRSRNNLSAIMIRQVMNGTPDSPTEAWFDRVDTPQHEDRQTILRATMTQALQELKTTLGNDPDEWRWGRPHTLELVHPLGRVKWLAPYFNLGPVGVPGGSQTVRKMQYQDGNYKVKVGPSMRQITDFSDLDGALAVIPAGQSGIPASPHYSDLMPLWLNGEYHLFPLSRSAVDALVVDRLVLTP